MERHEFVQHFNRHTTTGYRLTGNLDSSGEGAQAWVFSCIDRGGTELAAKVFKRPHDEQEVQEFQEEARRLNSLRHPNILSVAWLDTHEVTLQASSGLAIQQRRPFMIMERASCSLRDRMNLGKLPTSLAVAYGVQAMEGLEFVHQKTGDDQKHRIIHRDIKPANLLLVNDVIKIADFGISVAGHSQEESFTSTQVAAGTCPYMPPEQFLGRATVRSDLYSLAVVLYEALAGRRPITLDLKGIGGAESWIAWYHAHNTHKILPIEKVVEGKIDKITEHVQQPLFRALAKDQQDRFELVGALQEAVIRAFYRGAREQKYNRTHIATADKAFLLDPAKLPLLEEPEPETSRPPKSIPRRALLAGAAGIATAGIIGAVTLREPSLPTPSAAETLAQLERERHAVVAIATKAVTLLEAAKQPQHLPGILRQLIPYDPVNVATQIRALHTAGDTEIAAWLGAYLAPYNKEETQKILYTFISSQRYREATIIAAQLGQKVATEGTDKQDYQAVLEAAAAPTSAVAAQTLQKFMGSANHWAIRALALAMAPHAPEAVQQITVQAIAEANTHKSPSSTNEQLRDTWYTTAEELCRALAPYDAPAVVANCATIDDKGVDGYRATFAVQRIMLDLVPYSPSDVIAYIKNGQKTPKDWPTDRWRQTIAIAVSSANPDFVATLRKKSFDPHASWMDVALHPLTTTVAEKGLATFKDKGYIKEYTGEIIQALLKSRQPV